MNETRQDCESDSLMGAGTGCLTGRNSLIDFIKGVLIVAMVYGHACMADAPDRFVNLFHMTCFLFASGYFITPQKFETASGLWRFVKSRIVRLYVPYVVWEIVFLLLQNVFLKINVLSDNPLLTESIKSKYVYLVAPLSASSFFRHCIRTFLMIDYTVLTGQLWFVHMLFFVGLFYSFGCWLMMKVKLNVLFYQTVLAVVCLFIGKYVHGHYYKLIGGTYMFCCYGLFHFGVLLRKYLADILSRMALSRFFLIAILAAMVLVILFRINFYVCLAQNAYTSGTVVVILGVAAWIVMVFLFKICTNGCVIFTRMFQFIGQHTFPILIFHLLSFRIINLLIVPLSSHPICFVAAGPHLYSGLIWKLIYTVGGVAIPLIMWRSYCAINNFFKCPVPD